MKYLPILLLSVLFLSACGGKSEPKTDETAAANSIPDSLPIDKVIGLATIEPVQRILPLSSEVSGVVKELNITVGQRVTAGQVIAVLESDVERAQLIQAESRPATQKAQIESSKASLAALRVRIEGARVTYERTQRLLQGNAGTQQAVDDAKFIYENLVKEADVTQANIAQQTARLNELDADITYQKTMLSRRVVKAPASGVIISLDVKLGSNVTNTQQFGELAPDGGLMALTEIDELFALKVKEGQTAYIREQGGTEPLASGQVTLASPALRKKSLFSEKADNLEDRRVREVRIALDKDAKILIGARVEAVIQVQRK